MTSFAGSAGDPNAAQLIIENRAVQLEYAREQADKKGRDFRGGGSLAGDKNGGKTDWLCEACGCHNFARRDTCFRCNLGRTDNAIAVDKSGEPFGDSTISSDTPSCFLVVRGFASFVTDGQLMELFRQFSPVKSVQIIRDPQNRNAKGFAYVEFQSLEHAAYALQCSAELKWNKMELKVAYAREKVRQQMIIQMQNVQAMNLPTRFTTANHAGMQSALVAQAMQAAQWSINNGFATVGSSISVAGGFPTTQSAAAAALPLVVPAKIFWPPNFETQGGSYVFQPKTGYFLEPTTHFYYCPKSKLYYNGLDGTYYQYDLTLDPPFRKYELPLPLEEEPVVQEAATTVTAGSNGGAAESSSSTSRPLVSVSLSKVKGKVAAAVAPANKKVMKDLAKWGAIQKEEQDTEEEEPITTTAANNVFVKRSDKAAPVTAAAPTTATTASAPSSATKSTAEETKETTPAAATGSPVCLLCRRQFPSMEMLARHEKESKLHAENLAKKKLQEQQSQAPQYRDRAEERREKYGSVADHVPTRHASSASPDNGPSSLAASVLATASALLLPPPAPIKPATAVSEDLSNPGNQMLRKMGWKEGQGLGKEGEGREVALGVELSSTETEGSNMQATLKGTAGARGGGRGSAAAPSSSTYREYVHNAARARFEEISKSDK